jgi:hypothetical protein
LQTLSFNGLECFSKQISKMAGAILAAAISFGDLAAIHLASVIHGCRTELSKLSGWRKHGASRMDANSAA